MVSKRDLQIELTQLETTTIPKLMELDKAIKSLQEDNVKTKKHLLQIFDHLEKMLDTQKEHSKILEIQGNLLRKMIELTSEQYVPPKKETKGSSKVVYA